MPSMKFSIRDVLWLTVVVGLAIALIYANRPPAPLPPPPPAGRYELMSDPKSGYVFLLDSATGETWRYSGGSWTNGDLPVPSQPKP